MSSYFVLTRVPFYSVNRSKFVLIKFFFNQFVQLSSLYILCINNFPNCQSCEGKNLYRIVFVQYHVPAEIGDKCNCIYYNVKIRKQICDN